jgi:osmotically-inducible protein OsmY
MSASNTTLIADAAQPKAQVALSESPIYELRDLQVETTDAGLLISGTVDSYYHKQLAQEAVRAVVGRVPMINQILVRT